ncbi:MAG: iron-containing alcohol dehydrogenase, partial [Thiohalorhabdaceae bacterium]
EHHTPHGLTVALLLPEVMRFNATSAPERYAEIARILGSTTITESTRANAREMLGAAGG